MADPTLAPPRRGLQFGFGFTVFERYGQQQEALKGPNPRKHGRPSHHPLLAVLAEAHFILHGWLRSGNCGTARGGGEFLKEGGSEERRGGEEGRSRGSPYH